MITEDYVSFETAKLLKEKGFDAECRAFYVKSKECGIELFNAKEPYNYNNNLHPCTSAPTLQMAMKWLRKVHKLYIVVRPYVTEEGFFSLFEIKSLKEKGVIVNLKTKTGFNTSEEACEAVIKYCLENLI